MGVVRYQANVDPDLCHHMALQGHHELRWPQAQCILVSYPGM